MSSIIALLLAALPQAIIAIAAKVLTDKVLQDVLERIIIKGLREAAKLSSTDVDDQIVEDIARAIRGNSGGPA